MHQLVYRCSIARGEIPALLGLEERTARRVVRFLTDEGFIVSKTNKTPLCIAIPAHAATYIFPGLFSGFVGKKPGLKLPFVNAFVFSSPVTLIFKIR